MSLLRIILVILNLVCIAIVLYLLSNYLMSDDNKQSESLTIVKLKPGQLYPPTEGEVWPKPQQQITEQTYFKLSPSVFKFTEKGETCEILKNAIERYATVLRRLHNIVWINLKKTWKHAEPRQVDTNPDFKGTLEELQINLRRPCEDYPHMDMDENYSLNVSAVSSLTSDSIWGILRGMETFAQLFYLCKGYKDVLINSTQIVDFPRYTYRGLLIDTSRHYLSVANILKTLDAMEMNKMNVLHWHIVDDQSFPYQSEKFPKLSEQGAYDSSMIYTKANINKIVKYARDRGIRILPEFDVPGHTKSWGSAYPGILTECYKSGKVVGLGPMDPTKNITYKLIGELFHEVQELFPDKYFHLGGDEVALNCWTSNPEIQKFMDNHKLTNNSELHAYFMTKVLPLLDQKSKPIVWQEVFFNNVTLPSDAIVQVWHPSGPKDMIAILSKRHKVIYSSSWYLDQLHNGGDWVYFYVFDPRRILDSKLYKLEDIVGGEACMWGELVDDTNFIARVWPRASAAAEVLWSALDPQYTISNGSQIASRLEEHVCRMNRRGVRAQPANGPSACVGRNIWLTSSFGSINFESSSFGSSSFETSSFEVQNQFDVTSKEPPPRIPNFKLIAGHI
ncbi:beta-hexosaminidase subunit beta [Spodoptera frugiperda]|uniref:Beta-hexosaminidase n=1 Tax=Spodoptera frugiperda TaxID=7108 RepID=A0A9R0D2D2_SPOFR|nr:beta-hexosaminidase subunit beta [Spodoptera frugiperda]